MYNHLLSFIKFVHKIILKKCAHKSCLPEYSFIFVNDVISEKFDPNLYDNQKRVIHSNLKILLIYENHILLCKVLIIYIKT